jgi:tyrosyl-tRNA synthetase
MELGRRIVADFHTAAEADGAVEAFNLEVRQGKEPADIATVKVPEAVVTDKGIRIDKLLAAIGLAESVTDATRKLKAGAVEVNGAIYRELLLADVGGLLTLRAGKKWMKVQA